MTFSWIFLSIPRPRFPYLYHRNSDVYFMKQALRLRQSFSFYRYNTTLKMR